MVLTNSLALVEALARWCKVILVGGEVRVERRDVWGPITEETLRQFHVSKAFLGADAVHISSGFMTTDESTAKMNEIILRNATHAFVLADAEKFNRDSFIRYAALSEVETIFTDPGVAPDVLAEFPGRGCPDPGRAASAAAPGPRGGLTDGACTSPSTSGPPRSRSCSLPRTAGSCGKVIRNYTLATPAVNWYEADPEVYWDAVVSGTREILAASGVRPARDTAPSRGAARGRR